MTNWHVKRLAAGPRADAIAVNAYRFAQFHNGWTAYNRGDAPTVAAMRRLRRLGQIELNRFGQFRPTRRRRCRYLLTCPAAVTAAIARGGDRAPGFTRPRPTTHKRRDHARTI